MCSAAQFNAVQRSVAQFIVVQAKIILSFLTLFVKMENMIQRDK